MSFYSSLKETATRLILDKGKAATLLKPSAPTGSGWDRVPGTSTSHTVRLVETGYSITHHSELIQAGDKVGIMSAAVTPAMDDVLQIGSDQYRFIDIKPLDPGGTVLLYEFHARQ